MADIEMRFGKDMLVLSGSIDATLERQGVNINADRQYLNLFEPEVVVDALKLQVMAGARCLVTTTEDITPARLAHANAQADGSTLARAAVDIALQCKPQHILAAIGPCELPLDGSSASSLKENKGQYLQAAHFFDGLAFDAFLLDGFTSLDDLKCALMGVRQASDAPVFASVLVGRGEVLRCQQGTAHGSNQANDFDLSTIRSGLPLEGYQAIDNSAATGRPRTCMPLPPEQLTQAVDIMMEFGATVVGIETADSLNHAFEYATTVAEATTLPILVSLRAVLDPLDAAQKGLTPIELLENYSAESMPYVAEHLRKAGVQFLRATGDVDASFTAGLYAAVGDLDVKPRK